MIRLFNNNSAITLIYLIVVLFILKSSYLYNNLPAVYYSGTPLNTLIFNSLPLGSIWIKLLAIPIILVQAIVLKRIIFKHDLLYKKTYLPAYFYILYSCTFLEQQVLSVALIHNFFTFLLLDRAFSLYSSNKPYQTLLDMGFIVGVCTLLWVEYIFMLPFCIIAVNFFRPFIFKEFMMIMVAFFTPVIIAAAIFYLIDYTHLYAEYWDSLYFSFSQSKLFARLDFSLISGTILLILVLALLRLQRNFSRNTIKTKKSQQLIMLLLVTTLLVAASRPGNLFANINLMLIPTALFSGYYFLDSQRHWWSKYTKQFLGTGLFLLILYFQWEDKLGLF